ncbi:MAG: hypothetical protein A2Z16_11965 [Chloroflexi bacterium RBG_16_54_18]|nr:MAG: hypothetical protein A2Z16_11965 [Chloroflexi bacterium RBG_16_54_18]
MSSDLPLSTSLILVAVINHPRDLEIARVLGWYRIPLRSAPKVISIDYLAFYQTAAFEEQKWRIQYLAPYRGHELTTRLELIRDEPDHPHASKEYFKIQLGSLISLPHPISAENWRRITFFYTTGELLLNAHTIKDLIVPQDERQQLWQALRDRASQSQSYLPEPLPGLDSDTNFDFLSLLLGIKELEEGYLWNSSQEHVDVIE